MGPLHTKANYYKNLNTSWHGPTQLVLCFRQWECDGLGEWPLPLGCPSHLTTSPIGNGAPNSKKESDKLSGASEMGWIEAPATLSKKPTVIPYPGPKTSTSVNSFEHYLAGVIEGDGSIHVPKSERNAKNKLNYPSIQIAFALKDLAYALLIQKNLGHGSLHKVKGKNAYVLTINHLLGLIHVVSLINGKLRTPKNDSL